MFLLPLMMASWSLLDVLKEKKVKASFFLMGSKVIIHPDIVERIGDEGHDISDFMLGAIPRCQSYFHEVHSQLHRNSDAIFNATRRSIKIMRPPYGDTNDALNRYITSSEKLHVILFSLAARDWINTATPKDLISRVLGNIQPGSIILFQDTHYRSIDCMSDVINGIHKMGYEFRSVSEMMKLLNDRANGG